jgi:hypothetical protein
MIGSLVSKSPKFAKNGAYFFLKTAFSAPFGWFRYRALKSALIGAFGGKIACRMGWGRADKGKPCVFPGIPGRFDLHFAN